MRHYALENPGYFLLSLVNGVVTSVDGPHDSPQGVATALELFKRLGFWREDAVYRMVLVSAVEGEPGNINEEAAATMRRLVDRYRLS